MDFGKLMARAKAILTTPATEWPVIAGEATTTRDLYLGYIVPLAAIGPIAGFIKLSVFGIGSPVFGTVRLGVGASLGNMILSYVLALVGVYIVALVLDALAPHFGGQKDRLQALKTAAYASTAAWIAGIGQLVPVLGILIMLAGAVYSIYLLYLGLPVTMKAPKEKSVAYTAVTIVVVLVLGMVASAITSRMYAPAWTP